MLFREAVSQLYAWKKKRKKKCLMVRGARQVGKTTLVENFADKEYDNKISVNFLEKPAFKEIFSGDLDVDNLVTIFSLYLPGVRFIPGKTLLFLDEIQECPEAVTSLKFWANDGRYDVIASGSMLGIDYKRPTSYPVGSIEYLDMYSLGFSEFLRAEGITDEVIDKLHSCFIKTEPVPYAIHNRMMQLLRTYIVIGGMPEVVSDFLSERSFAAADIRQRAILQDYRYDIAHYAQADVKIKAENCYFSLPDQLAKENHKFQYTVVEKGGNARKYKGAMDWLAGACLINRVYNVSRMSLPLRSYREETHFRVYPADIGLLCAMYPYEMKERLLSSEKGSVLKETKGGIYEALIADMLYKNGHSELFFRKNEQATFELEFLIDTKDGIVPIEVKAGNSRSRSLDRALEQKDIPYGYKLVDGNAGRHDKKITLPLYMAMFL